MYSLIVSAAPDQWDATPAHFSVDRYLEHTAPDIATAFRLSREVADKLTKLPTVFAYETGSGPIARVGTIKDLNWSASTFRIGFEFDQNIPPIDLAAFYRASDHLGITAYEPSRTHWSIKDVDLASALEVAGLITAQQAEIMRLPIWLRPLPVPGTAVPKPPTQVIGNRANLAPTTQVTLTQEIDSTVPAVAPDHLAARIATALHPPQQPAQLTSPQRVFVVHGRNRELKADVVLFLKRIGVEPIVLHEQVNAGRTIFEKFGDIAAGVDFAVVLLTPDDIGGLSREELQPRARQNVVLELGYFIGKLGKEHVCALKLGEVEIPSDFFGVLYLPADGDGWKLALAKELNAAGIRIDHEKLVYA